MFRGPSPGQRHPLFGDSIIDHRGGGGHVSVQQAETGLPPGDSSQRRLREQGRDLDESRRSLDELTEASPRARSASFVTELEDKERQLRQLESQLRTYRRYCTASRPGTQDRPPPGSPKARMSWGERDWVAEIVTQICQSSAISRGMDLTTVLR